MQKAETIGTFQVESRAQMATLAADEAGLLLRCGDRGGNHPARADRRRADPSVPGAAQREASRRSNIIILPCEPLLERTLGVPLFQEQMLQIAMIMAGFNGEEVEELSAARFPFTVLRNGWRKW